MDTKTIRWFGHPLKDSKDLLEGIAAFWEKRLFAMQTIVVSSEQQFTALEELLSQLDAPVILIHGDGKRVGHVFHLG